MRNVLIASLLSFAAGTGAVMVYNTVYLSDPAPAAEIAGAADIAREVDRLASARQDAQADEERRRNCRFWGPTMAPGC